MGDCSNEGDETVLGRLEDAMQIVQQIMKVCNAASISLGVLYEKEVIMTKSFGFRDIEHGLKANGDTSYLLGSCSKMITSTALGILAEEQKLFWKDPISKHLPSFNPIGDPDIGAKASIIDACRHSTGLANPNAVFLGPRGTISNTEEDHISMLNALPTSNKFGQRFGVWWYYSNAAFGLLGLVIQVISGKKYAEFLREKILEPLGLRQTLVTEAESKENNNIAYPYVKMDDGSWAKIESGITSEKHTPTLAAMGIRSSVNDMLGFLAAVMNRYDVEKGIKPSQPLLHLALENPLRQIRSMWNYWWTRPIEDNFENKTAYTLGWYRTTIPSGAVGLTSYNYRGHEKDDKSWTKYIIGQDLQSSHTLYGHNGISNGSVATAYLFPSSHTAVVVLSNTANFGDAAESTAQVLIQAIFDLKPHVDLLESLHAARKYRQDAFDRMITAWKRSHNNSNYNGSPEDFEGHYVGLNTSRISIVPSDSAAAKLAVIYADNVNSRCDLEPYNKDALSFLPKKRDELLRNGMIDWDYYKVGIFEFQRDPDKDNMVVGFWWQWDEHDYAGLWAKKTDGMGEDQLQNIFKKFGKFRAGR